MWPCIDFLFDPWELLERERERESRRRYLSHSNHPFLLPPSSPSSFLAVIFFFFFLRALACRVFLTRRKTPCGCFIMCHVPRVSPATVLLTPTGVAVLRSTVLRAGCVVCGRKAPRAGSYPCDLHRQQRAHLRARGVFACVLRVCSDALVCFLLGVFCVCVFCVRASSVLVACCWRVVSTGNVGVTKNAVQPCATSFPTKKE